MLVSTLVAGIRSFVSAMAKPATTSSAVTRLGLSLDMELDFHHFETIESTNTWALDNIRSFNSHKITVVSADFQTAGRGRKNRVWLSPPGSSLLVTFAFFLPLSTPHLPNITQLLAVSSMEALQSLGVTSPAPRLKWPNDILLDGRKVGGILAQISTAGAPAGCLGLVVGLGLNVAVPQPVLDAINLDRPVWPASSVLQASKVAVSVASLQSAVTARFSANLRTFLQCGFEPFVATVGDSLALSGQPVTMTDGTETFAGVQTGVDADGRLLLRLASGETRALSSAEHVYTPPPTSHTAPT